MAGETITEGQVRRALIQPVGEAKLSPVFFGSAITGVGVRELLANLGSYVPSHTSLEDGPLSGVVFKLEKEATGEKVVYIRVYSGSMHVRTCLNLQRRRPDGGIETYTGKIHKLHVFLEGKTVQAQRVGAGEFCKVWGLKAIKIGDVVGAWSDQIKTLHFATPLIAASGSLQATYPAPGYIPVDGHAACGNVRNIQERTSHFYGG